MHTIEFLAEIDQNHQIHLQLPETIKAGKAKVIDLEMSPFDGQGGLGKMYKLFGADMDNVLDELNEVLAA